MSVDAGVEFAIDTSQGSSGRYAYTPHTYLHINLANFPSAGFGGVSLRCLC